MSAQAATAGSLQMRIPVTLSQGGVCCARLMERMGHLTKLLALAAFATLALYAQSPGGPDFLDLARLKDFSARRVSSNNPDPASNDDSKRPIPGETLVL